MGLSDPLSLRNVIPRSGAMQKDRVPRLLGLAVVCGWEGGGSVGIDAKGFSPHQRGFSMSFAKNSCAAQGHSEPQVTRFGIQHSFQVKENTGRLAPRR
jgi:hypothetical protein